MRRTNTILMVLLFVCGFGPVLAPAQTGAEASAGVAAGPDAKLSADELEELVAPIALYPDVLIAQILPAATFPTDVVMAARWRRSNLGAWTKPVLAELAAKPWDESVKALCNYPPVLYKLDEDLEWTNALGAAFLNQPDDVMAAIQVGRTRASAEGVLQTNKEQTIVVEQEAIRIVPTQTEVVYVPTYDPEIVYVSSGVSTGAVVAASAISFGTGLALGAWLNMDCNWHGHNVYYCQPGYWGGWPHHGVVAWGDNWIAGAGPRRAFAVGEDRGVVVGPRGGAAWGPNGGAVWRRPPVATPLPAYGGRYASYGNRYGGSYYGSRNVYNNVNVNRNNVNIDRGNRTNIGGGSRTNFSGGDRTGPGAAERRAGSPGTGTRPPTERPSAFDGHTRPQQSSQYSQRGQQSRDVARPNASPPRPSSPAPQARPAQTPSPQRTSAFNSGQSGRQTSQYSGRGAASRGFGGGGRGGGRH